MKNVNEPKQLNINYKEHKYLTKCLNRVKEINLDLAHVYKSTSRYNKVETYEKAKKLNDLVKKVLNGKNKTVMSYYDFDNRINKLSKYVKFINLSRVLDNSLSREATRTVLKIYKIYKEKPEVLNSLLDILENNELLPLDETYLGTKDIKISSNVKSNELFRKELIDLLKDVHKNVMFKVYLNNNELNYNVFIRVNLKIAINTRIDARATHGYLIDEVNKLKSEADRLKNRIELIDSEEIKKDVVRVILKYYGINYLTDKIYYMYQDEFKRNTVKTKLSRLNVNKDVDRLSEFYSKLELTDDIIEHYCCGLILEKHGFKKMTKFYNFDGAISRLDRSLRS